MFLNTNLNRRRIFMFIKSILLAYLKSVGEVTNALYNSSSYFHSFVRGSALENQIPLDTMTRPQHSMLFPHIKRIDAWIEPRLTSDQEAFSNFIQKEFEKCGLKHHSTQFSQEEILRKYWQDIREEIYKKFFQERRILLSQKSLNIAFERALMAYCPAKLFVVQSN